MRNWRAVVVCVAAGTAACASLIGLEDVPPGAADAGLDAGNDTARPDASSLTDARSPDASSEAAEAAVYNDMTQASNWSTFDVSKVPGVAVNATVYTLYAGAAFDGRYLYLAPSTLNNDAFGIDGTEVLRFDTHGSFEAVASWATFDLSPFGPYAGGFNGAAFDGRYVYLVPANAGQGAPVPIMQYDTTAPFGSVSSWSAFDVTTVSPQAGGYAGATFDGRYLYLAPLYLVTTDGGLITLASSGLVTRYDTTAPFRARGSWSIFDTAALNPDSVGFTGGLYDGRNAYFVPNRLVSFDGGAPAHYVARYDTQGSFDDAGSWSVFDTTTSPPDAQAAGFSSGAFDGRYVYLAPQNNNGIADGLVVRYDSHASFEGQVSWVGFDTTTISGAAAGYSGAAFDGRYVYLVPFDNGALDGLVARWDTAGSFADAGAWTTFDTQSLDPKAGGFSGAAFDGQYLYLVPVRGSIMARFDARSPGSMPDLYGEAGPPFYGSFY